ncbi:hydrogen peroxide-inducible genes activator [Gellertiella hungarica]|uniref:LysR family hydrogen peroxide-inducible transcriptional activator n=1 Tax=Gellertiella hungarica TaxID=1572859 RepID=A0A7W6NL39_9HYPH|nr:hydrogen peroxide-inducible genes activator [Gellertiella hungarica]MBB4066140.1 LysR family hydrogen peroxide-inducible transcriptional activator [Gellertiella hungarica]
MNNLSMKHMRYFDALARHGHFGRAAADCSVSQPALSVQIKELEALIGARLVERSARQIRLTPLGERFAARVRDILQAVDELDDLSRASRRPFTGQFRIGVIPTVAPYLLPRLIMGLGEIYGGLDIRPREAVTRKLLADLADGRLDAAIVALPVAEASFAEKSLFEEEFVLVRPIREAGAPVPGLEELQDRRLLLLEEGHCFREQAIAFCKIAPTPSRDLIEGSSLTTLVQMVGADIGVTLIPDIAVPMETRSASVAVARLPEPRPSRTIGMVWRKTNPLGDELAAIAETMAGMDLARNG